MLGTVMLASLSLPGVLPKSAKAEEAPEHGVVGVKWLSYKDWQKDLDRISVSSPSLYLLLPLGARWSIEGSGVYDSVSGATPRYHSSVSGATTVVGMNDQRKAGDLKLMRYFDRSAFGVGMAYSTEHDYQSRSASIDGRLSTADNNTTFNFGLGASNDTVGSRNNPALNEARRTREATLGVTQALSKNDLAQISLTYSSGKGYYSDPYKLPDARPNRRDESIALLRWNHYFEGSGAALRSSYRFYDDSFGIRAHTLDLQWVQQLGESWTVTPLLRYYSQRAADFYYDPVYDAILGPPYPPNYLTNPPRYLSADQRLSAFGAVTLGLKIEWNIQQTWIADVKYERYKQRGDWRIGDNGSPGLETFNARFFQIGLRRSL